MKIQNIGFIQHNNVVKKGNINFRAQEKNINENISTYHAFQGIFVDENGNVSKKEPEQIPEVKFYYVGANDEAKESYLPILKEASFFGDRLFVLRGNRKIPYVGFKDEKLSGKAVATMYRHGYPFLRDTYEEGELVKTEEFDYMWHKVFSVKKDGFSLQKSGNNMEKVISMSRTCPDGTVFVRLKSPHDDDIASVAELITADSNNEIQKRETIVWNNNECLPERTIVATKEDAEEFKEALDDLSNTINSDEYKNDFGMNSKINRTLCNIIDYLEKCTIDNN